ncbi:hypothetical protein PGB90_003968 [Kerria lacca]
MAEKKRCSDVFRGVQQHVCVKIAKLGFGVWWWRNLLPALDTSQSVAHGAQSSILK